MARYWLTPTANIHYRKVVSDTHQKWGRTQADKYRAALRAGFQKIAEEHTSFRFPHREGLAKGTGFALHLVEHHYVAFQEQDENTVVIVGIFHESMDIPERLKELNNMSEAEIASLRPKTH